MNSSAACLLALLAGVTVPRPINAHTQEERNAQAVQATEIGIQTFSSSQRDAALDKKSPFVV